MRRIQATIDRFEPLNCASLGRELLEGKRSVWKSTQASNTVSLEELKTPRG